MTRALIIILTLCTAPAQAADIFGRIDYLQATNAHLISRPWSGHFEALNGTHFNHPEFYKNRRPELNLKSGVAVVRRRNLKASLTLHYDHGYASDLYEAAPYLGLGVGVLYAPRDNLLVSFYAFDVAQIGGKVRERPCYDDFRREFHCGTGNAWRDVKEQLNRRFIKPSAYLRITRRF